jgi:hypothetical protein
MKKLFACALTLICLSAHAFTCDSDQELKDVKTSKMKKANSREFSKQYDRQYEELWTSIRALAKQLNLPPEQLGKAQELYTASRSGQRQIETLSRLKQNFSYDAVSAYLFDSKSLNSKPVHYTRTFEKDGLIYYLDGDRVVARLTEIEDGAYRLQVYTPQCGVREVVQLSSLNSRTDDLIQIKVNPAFCKMVGNYDLSLMDEDAQNEKGVYFNMPSEEHEASQMKQQLNKACESTHSTATQPVPTSQPTRLRKTHSNSKGAK